jgi:hypothetical protein
MHTIAELERAIERLPRSEFEILADWVEERSRAFKSASFALESKDNPVSRDHTAFLNSYAPEDEGLYDDAAVR